MLSKLSPHVYLDSVLELEALHLQGLGIRGLLLDVDSTLKDYHADGFSDEIRSWVQELRMEGIKLCLLSNGRERRISRLAQLLDIPFVARAFKPFPIGCHRAMDMLGLSRREAAIVGDQLFADILAGHFAGIFTILVRPTHPAEPWFTRLKRPFERLALQHLTPPCLEAVASKGPISAPALNRHP